MHADLHAGNVVVRRDGQAHYMEFKQGIPQDRLIEVRDGSRLVMLRPDEIDWVSAAGNYVELHGSFGSELARRTMADIEATLAPHGFVRVHRSRLVRRAAIAAIETRQSGDFDMMMRSGSNHARSAIRLVRFPAVAAGTGPR